MSLLIDKALIHRISSTLKANQPLRINLPLSGTLNIDQPVPFLLAYRFPPDGKDLFSYHLGKTESSYIMAANDGGGLLQRLIKKITNQLADQFGGFLLLEVWVGDNTKTEDFTIYIGHKSALPVAEILKEELSIQIGFRQLQISIEKKDTIAPEYYTPMLTREEAKLSGTLLMGLEIRPGYINTSNGKSYPLYTRELRNAFGKALKKAFFEYVRLHTSYNASHFQMLGTTIIEDLVWEIDEKLADYTQNFDLLFLITPVNVEQAWQEFKKSNFQKPPVFHYRHMPIDPEIIKRKIYELPIENITDPTIAFLFRDKRKEIDRMLTMLIDREKADFIQSSLLLFGKVEENLLDVAKGLLVAIPADSQRKKEFMHRNEFEALVEDELNFLKEQFEGVTTKVNVRDDIEGILVSRGVLSINKNFCLERSRAEAMIQHEVGTHVATYYNGMAQPFKLFYTGVPGYEQLQEGLAVLAEYLVGGLTNNRIRTLAARVVAVHHMVAGHPFTDTFFMLTDKYLFKPEQAFSISMRVYRGGGLTKDALYLKGLISLLEYMKEGKDIKPLLAGKIRQDYIPILDELLYRRILKPIPITPRYLDGRYQDKIKKIQRGINVFNLTQSCELHS